MEITIKETCPNKLKVEDAARLMGVSPQYIRIGLQRGIFPWGYAVQMTAKRYTYFISRQKFCAKLGIEL